MFDPRDKRLHSYLNVTLPSSFRFLSRSTKISRRCHLKDSLVYAAAFFLPFAPLFCLPQRLFPLSLPQSLFFESALIPRPHHLHESGLLVSAAPAPAGFRCLQGLHPVCRLRPVQTVSRL